MVTIVQKGDPILRKKAEAVAVQDITSPKIQKIIADMKEALASQKDGVAIAAPQIGVPLRIFVVSGGMLKEALKGKYKGDDMVFINPLITKLSKDKSLLEEGCLSVRWLYGKIKRSNKASIRAYDERGLLVERGASGLLAQIFQHETDHLEGVLFIDNACDIEEMPPEEREMNKELERIEMDKETAPRNTT
jgi:peptide deformylase